MAPLAALLLAAPWDTGSTGPCTIALGGAGNNIVTLSGVMSDTEGFILSGTGIPVLSGTNNTYGTAGTTEVSGGTLVLANASGSATVASAVEVENTSSTLTGNGITTGTVDNFGNISATNMAGGTAILTTASQTWEAGSIYQWAINNASGTAGAASGWNQITINGGLTINANSSSPMGLNIISLTSANQQGAGRV